MFDLGDPGADQEPTQGSTQTPVTTELTVQASAFRSSTAEDVSELPAQRTIEPMAQQPAPSVNGGFLTDPRAENAAELPI